MIQRRSLTFLYLLNLITSILSGQLLQRWTYEPIEVTTYSANTNLIDAHVDIIRLGRGQYGFSGYAFSKFDIYDDTVIRLTCEKSLYRDGPYYPTLFNTLNDTVSSFINKFYIPHFMSTAAKCCENCPVYNRTFVAPLKKTHIKMHRCDLTTDNMPNIMPTGYYKTRITAFTPFEVYVEYLAYLENKVF